MFFSGFIETLMKNDKNATWDEVETLTELKESLLDSISNYGEGDDEYKFYNKMLREIINTQEKLMLSIAKDLLYYGYGFDYFKNNYGLCVDAGDTKCREVWEKAINIMERVD